MWHQVTITANIPRQTQSTHTRPELAKQLSSFFFILSAVLRVRARALSLILVCGVGFIYFYKRTNTDRELNHNKQQQRAAAAS